MSSKTLGPSLVFLLAVTACGEDEPAAISSTDLDGGGGSGGAAPGSGGGANAGAGGGAGAQAVSCTGTWGTSGRELLRASATGIQFSSPTLSPDELELFYSVVDDVPSSHFRRSVRASKTDVFPEGSPVPELDAACADPAADRHMDLSADGLRAYLVCTMEPPPLSGALRVARRSAIGSPFTLDAMAIGTVGPSVAIAKDELTADSTTFTRPGPALVYTRENASSPFSTGKPVPGLEMPNYATPEPSPDGLSLFGNLDSSIQVATRAIPSGSFGAPMVVIDHGPEQVIGAPELSYDCRSLYYVDVNTASTPSVYSIWVRTR